MRDLALLLRVQILSLANSLAPRARGGGRGGGRRARLALVAGLAALVIAMVAGYMVAFAWGLAAVGLARAIPALAIIMGALAGVFFTFMKAMGTLFGLRDFDLVMALPIPRRTVVASRLGALLAMALLIAAVLMVPLWAVYFAVVGATVRSVLIAVASVALAPAAPTGIAAFLAFGVNALASRFRHVSIACVAIAILLTAAVTIGALWLSSSVRGSAAAGRAEEVAGLARAIGGAVGLVWPPAGWVADAMDGGGAAPLAGFVAVSLAVPAACLEIVQRRYLALNGMLAARATRAMGRRELDARAARRAGPLAAMVVKELRCILGVPYYAFQCLSGYAFMIALFIAVAAVGAPGAIAAVAAGAGVGSGVGAGSLLALAPWVFALLSVMGCSAAVAVSMEGRGAWIMAAAPVPARTVLASKLIANAAPLAATQLVGTALLLAFGRLPPLEALEVPVVSLGVFHAVVSVGMAIDVSRPNFSWTAPAEVVKRSLPIMVCSLGGTVLVLAGGLGAWLIMGSLGADAAAAWNLSIGAAGCVIGQIIFARTAARARLHLS